MEPLLLLNRFQLPVGILHWTAISAGQCSSPLNYLGSDKAIRLQCFRQGWILLIAQINSAHLCHQNMLWSYIRTASLRNHNIPDTVFLIVWLPL